jgi:putative peptide zinc metalloprotease protein
MTITTPDDRADALGEVRDREGPHLAEGVELLGAYEDSGYREPPLMVRRADNQLVQLPPALYLIAQRLDGSRDVDTVAAEVSQEIERELAAEDVEYLIDEKLRPLGIVASPDGEDPTLEKLDPLLALRLRKGVVPKNVVGALARVFAPLFWPPVLAAAMAGFVAFDVWLFFSHGVAGGAREALYRPGLLLFTIGLVIGAAAFHELGHAAACRYGGADPGVMGMGLYIVWPAFYTDVTDAYRLGRGGRLRTDLGGVYFNALFVLALGGIYAVTGLESLLLVVVLVHFEMVHQMLPFLRLDGYYVVSDLVGVPDLFQRMRPILTSFVPWLPSDPRVAELKPWVRWVVTAWVLVVVPLLVFQVLVVVMVAPRLVGTAWDSMRSSWDTMAVALSDGSWLEAIGRILQLLLLLLPLAGIAYLFWMLAARFVQGWRTTKGRPVARSLLSTAGVAFLLFVALTWWPVPGRFAPIQEDEQWTLPTVVGAVATVPMGAGGLSGTDADSSAGADPRAPLSTNTGGISPSPTAEVTSSTSTTPEPTVSPTTSTSPSISPTPTATASPTPSVVP